MDKLFGAIMIVFGAAEIVFMICVSGTVIASIKDIFTACQAGLFFLLLYLGIWALYKVFKEIKERKK